MQMLLKLSSANLACCLDLLPRNFPNQLELNIQRDYKSYYAFQANLAYCCKFLAKDVLHTCKKAKLYLNKYSNF